MQWVMLTAFNRYVPKCKCGWHGLDTSTYLMAERSCKAHHRRKHG